MKPKISFIIPAYNASSTIDHCINSIYALPLGEQQFEVIVIDDCSIDNTLEILEEYAKIHNNLVLLRQSENKRQGAARNKGISIAKGEYTAFVDSDDSIVVDGFFKALNAVLHSKVDICYFEFEYEMPRGEWHTFKLPTELYDTILPSEIYLNDYYTCYYNAPWRTLYKTKFLKGCNIAFEEGVRWEDCDWTVKVYAKSTTIQFVKGIGYRYAYGENATSRQKTNQARYERILAGVRLMKFSEVCKISGLKKTLYDEALYSYIHSELRLRNLTKYTYKENVELFKKLRKKDLSYIAQNTKKWLSVITRYNCLCRSILFFACPIAKFGRKLMMFKRILL